VVKVSRDIYGSSPPDNDFSNTYEVTTMFSMDGTFSSFFSARIVSDLVITGNQILDFSVLEDKFEEVIGLMIDTAFAPHAVRELEPLYFAPEKEDLEIELPLFADYNDDRVRVQFT
jgi:hypothetical protein